MTKPEETNEELVEAYQKNKDTKFLDLIIKRNQYFADYVMRKFYVNYNYEDTRQELLLTFKICADRYDASKNIKFMTYVYTAMKRKVGDINKARKQVSYIDQNVDLSDMRTSPLTRLYKTETISFCNNLLNNLSSRDRDIIRRRFGLSGHSVMTLQTLADRHSVSKEAIRQRTNTILSGLKNKIQESGMTKTILSVHH